MSKRYLFVSIKPKFIGNILEGIKTIELRKSKPQVSKGDILIIYATYPQKEIVATATIQNIIQQPIELLWENFGINTGITYHEFLNYYKNYENGIGIKISNVKELNKKIHLNFLKSLFGNFTPPQTYRYINYNDFSKIIN